MNKAVNEGSQWVKDMQQRSKRYETARTKVTFKTKQRTKQIYIS